MLGWSINLFKVFGIQLAVHASFLLLLVYAAWMGWQDGGGILGAGWGVAFTGLFFICVILHELGHSLTARRYGIRVPRILLLPIGGMAEFDRIPREPSAELLITIAGPAVNFVIAVSLALAVGLPPGWPLQAEYPDTLPGAMQFLLSWNLGMGLFNLLPVFPMDGGRILRALLAFKLPYLNATRWAVMIGKVLALSFALLAVLYLEHPLMICLLFLFIFWAGDAEYKALLRREQEARYWEELARQVRPPEIDPLEPKPPLLPYHGPN